MASSFLSNLPSYLRNNPAFRAFAAASGYQSQLDAADAARRTSELQEGYNLTMEDLGQTGEEQREAIAGGYESRGTFRSGEHLTQQARQEARQGRASSLAALGLASGVGDIQSSQARAAIGRDAELLGRAINTAAAYGEAEGSVPRVAPGTATLPSATTEAELSSDPFKRASSRFRKSIFGGGTN